MRVVLAGRYSGLMLNRGSLSNLARRVFIREAVRFLIRELAGHCSAQFPVLSASVRIGSGYPSVHDWPRVCFPRRSTIESLP